MAEAHDRGVGVVVAGAIVPAIVVGVRAELDHAERHGGARIRMTVAASPDFDLQTCDVRLAARLGKRQCHFFPDTTWGNQPRYGS